MRVHFIAIGGSAMHNLALALHFKGDRVTGSDDAIFEPSKSRLEAVGLLPESLGWDASRITEDIEAVILGMHAKADNPELLKAQELGLEIFSYPEFLYNQAQTKTRVVIGGSHGKTTITSMILHVLNYWDMDVDYMVGAQLEGFDTMVKLTDQNEFMVLEGDEYLSSALDLRPKFHLYRPNIALLTGIAWDHINVFPTFENYVEQFKLFIESITDGGILVYNEEDPILKELVESSSAIVKKYPYKTPDYEVSNEEVYIDTNEGEIPLEIFGAHNMQNMAGAQEICYHMGVGEDDFFEAISSFKGASKRLEKLFETQSTLIFKDFAHSPSKVAATTNAVKEQYPNKNLLACLELHTYSSLNPVFLKEYKDALNAADRAMVFYDPKALEIKKMPAILPEQIKEAFGREDLQIFIDATAFKKALWEQSLEQTTLLMMSSGNYGGLDLKELKALI
ncbi:MAG: UDP-N-acetylmuramate--L-alanine ligase [Flavobacteriaceae bacterium]